MPKNGGGGGEITVEIVATNVIATRPPNTSARVYKFFPHLQNVDPTFLPDFITHFGL